MESEFYVVILVTLFGFTALAALLLIPVYRFLRREEDVSASWTEAELQKSAEDKDTNHTPPPGDVT